MSDSDWIHDGIIDGKAAAAGLRAGVAAEVARLRERHQLQPGLAVVLAGNDPASQVYVRNKGKQTVDAGMLSREHKLPETVSEAELLKLVAELNRDPAVHGILVQLPLPGAIDEQRIIQAIDPAKDVDGFHPANAGRLASGDPAALAPCTPLGCLLLLQAAYRKLHPESGGRLQGADALVIGRSNIVGKPMAQLLLRESCTVSIAHSKTRDLPGVCRRADIVVAAVGRAEMVKGDWLKEGAVVIDVGINRVPAEGDGGGKDGAGAKSGAGGGGAKNGAGGKARLVGDVAFAEAREVAAAVTPVPGGVGPMTIACLLRNTAVAACRQSGIESGLE